jgi:hypothetical protein
VAQLYPLVLSFLFIASYDSQGYGGGILTRLHTGIKHLGTPLSPLIYWYRGFFPRKVNRPGVEADHLTTKTYKRHSKIKWIFINIITQYSPSPLRHNVYIAHTTNLTPQKTLPKALPSVSSLVTVCWIDEKASNLGSSITNFNLVNRKSQPALNHGSRVDGITRRSHVWPKTRTQRPKNAPVHCRVEDTRTSPFTGGTLMPCKLSGTVPPMASSNGSVLSVLGKTWS